MILIVMAIFSNALCKLELFYKLGMPYIQSIKQSMIKLNINKQICCYGYIFFANKLFITKIFLTFLISIYKSVQNL